MASWEQAVIEEVTRVTGGENPVENIDHEARVIEIKRNVRVEPSTLRNIEQAVHDLGIGPLGVPAWRGRFLFGRYEYGVDRDTFDIYVAYLIDGVHSNAHWVGSA
jgi:hypothetical protein